MIFSVLVRLYFYAEARPEMFSYFKAFPTSVAIAIVARSQPSPTIFQ